MVSYIGMYKRNKKRIMGLLFLTLIMKEVISFELDHYLITFTNQLEMEEPSILMISTFDLLKLLTHIGMLSLVTKAIYNNGSSFTS